MVSRKPLGLTLNHPLFILKYQATNVFICHGHKLVTVASSPYSLEETFIFF